MLAAAAEEVGDDRRALERLCVATRQVRPVSRLLRFVVSPDGVLTPDIKRRLPGRGVWVTASRASFEEAVRRKAFTRSLRRPVTVSADLADTIDHLLERASLDMLSLANKAGLVVAGYAKVLSLIEDGRAAAILEAQEAAEDGRRKLASAVRRAHVTGPPPPVITIFQSSHFDLALGRSNVIHAALGAGPAATGFLDRVAALTYWRDGGLAPAGPVPARESPPYAEVDPSERDDGPVTGGNEFLDENRGDPQDLARND